MRHSPGWGAKKKRAREGNTPRGLCPADSFPFDRIVVTDNSSLEKLLIEDCNNEKEKKQQQQSASYDTLLLLLKFCRSQGSNLGKPEFSQAFFSQLHKLPAYLTVIPSLHLFLHKQFLTPETTRVMGTSFQRNDFWDRFGGQVLVMIGRWYSRQPLTNHK